MARYTWNLPPIAAPASVIESSGLRVPDGYERTPLPPNAPKGSREAWRKGDVLVITGEPGNGDENDPEYEAHNCDFMGCGWDHVLERREPTEAPDADR